MFIYVNQWFSIRVELDAAELDADLILKPVLMPKHHPRPTDAEYLPVGPNVCWL